MRLRRPLLSIAFLPLLASLACGSGPDDTLPTELMVRSDVPYVRGRVVEREVHATAQRVRVRDEPGSQARVTEAIVTVPAGARLLWRNGEPARPGDLVVGREVIVWTDGAELRSNPPQVTAQVIVLERF